MELPGHLTRCHLNAIQAAVGCTEVDILANGNGAGLNRLAARAGVRRSVHQGFAYGAEPLLFHRLVVQSHQTLIRSTENDFALRQQGSGGSGNVVGQLLAHNNAARQRLHDKEAAVRNDVKQRIVQRGRSTAEAHTIQVLLPSMLWKI